MIPRNEALELIEGLERASRRARPLMLYGLIAIIAGFVTLCAYLYNQREEERARAEALNAEAGELRNVLDQARQLAARLDSDPNADDDLRYLLLRARRQAGELVATVAEAPSSPSAAVPGSLPARQAPSQATSAPPATKNAPQGAPIQSTAGTQPYPATVRVFIHISSEDQRSQALELGLLLRSRRLGESAIVVPGIELVPGRGDNSLRCLKRQDCGRLAELAALIRPWMLSREIRTIDLSGRYESARNIRPGTYELWLAPGRVEIPPM